MMHEIDTSGWKEFVIGGLFEISRPMARRKDSYADGDVPFVASGCFNNGVMKMVAPHDDEQIDDGNCLTVSPLDGCTFYQPADFLGRGGAGSAIIILRNENLSLTVGLFIAAVLSETLKAHSYIDQISSASVTSMTIKLPTISSGDPDWEYMDAYMSGILTEERDYANELAKKNFVKHEIDTSEWKEFPIGGESGLFDVVKGTRLTKADMIEGDINFISASSFNNGIAAHVGNTEHIHPGNLLTVSYNGSDIGRTFYQADPFWASDDVNVLYPRFAMTEHIALFLAPLIKEAGSSHMYKDKWLQTDMMAAKILLPISHDGRPDWNYMDAYMSKIMSEEKSVVDELTAGCD